MTLSEWEQSNIEVLTSREMGEWLGHRENRLLDNIRAEIDQYLFQNEFGSEYRKEVLQIIDKYKAESSKEI